MRLLRCTVVRLRPRSPHTHFPAAPQMQEKRRRQMCPARAGRSPRSVLVRNAAATALTTPALQDTMPGKEEQPFMTPTWPGRHSTGFTMHDCLPAAEARFPKFEALNNGCNTLKAMNRRNRLRCGVSIGEIEPEPKSAARCRDGRSLQNPPMLRSAVGWRSNFMSGRTCGYEAREFDPRQGARQRSALRRPRIKWRDAGRQGAAFDPANVLVCVLSPVSRV